MGGELKEHPTAMLREADYEVIDFADGVPTPDDDHPDFVAPLARAVFSMDRDVAIRDSGVGACIAANKLPGARVCPIHEARSARQKVEDDDLNVMCLGGLVVSHALALELVKTFLAAGLSGAERHRRRLTKITALENKY